MPWQRKKAGTHGYEQELRQFDLSGSCRCTRSSLDAWPRNRSHRSLEHQQHSLDRSRLAQFDGIAAPFPEEEEGTPPCDDEEQSVQCLEELSNWCPLSHWQTQIAQRGMVLLDRKVKEQDNEQREDGLLTNEEVTSAFDATMTKINRHTACSVDFSVHAGLRVEEVVSSGSCWDGVLVCWYR